MNNLLIPTDFTPASVQLAARALKALNKKSNIVFFHAFQMPYFLNDLLTNEPPYLELMNDRLRQACRNLKEQYPELTGTITFKFMRGDTNALFRNFIDANDITMIVCPKEYVYEKVHKDSINPTGFFKRSKLPVMQTFLTPERQVVLKEKLEHMEVSVAF